MVGITDGMNVGKKVGSIVGSNVGSLVGSMVGSAVGSNVGSMEGDSDGNSVGIGANVESRVVSDPSPADDASDPSLLLFRIANNVTMRMITPTNNMIHSQIRQHLFCFSASSCDIYLFDAVSLPNAVTTSPSFPFSASAYSPLSSSLAVSGVAGLFSISISVSFEVEKVRRLKNDVNPNKTSC